MGRRSQPTDIKMAKGERRPSRVNYDEPALDAPAGLQAPKGLVGAGLVEWRRLADHLAERGVLTIGDVSALEDYCRTLTDLRRYEDAARAAGAELAIAKGYAGAVVKLRQQANQLRQQLGLTPVSRSSVKTVKGQKPSKPASADRYLRAIPGGKPPA